MVAGLLNKASLAQLVHTGPQKEARAGKAMKEKDALSIGMERLLNRSPFKGIMDGAERSHALSGDALRKLGSLEAATGKGMLSLIREVAKAK